MAHTAHRNAEMLEEIFHSPEELNAKTAEVAKRIRAAKRIVVHTGAGLSNAGEEGCDIPDYRSAVKTNEKGETVGGFWELQARGVQSNHKYTPMHLARPSIGHLAIAEIMRRYTDALYISTNVDGLNARLVRYDQLAQLHGDGHMEECAQCGAPAFREFSIGCQHEHITGRKCYACDGPMLDSIINFGENLPPLVLEKAYNASAAADLHIVLGSSLSVTPACDLPRETIRNGGKVVIVNIQRTPLDKDFCSVRVHAKINDFFLSLFSHLEWQIPKFVARKQVFLERQQNVHDGSTCSVRFCGMLPDSQIPMSNFGTISLVKPDDHKAVLDKIDFSASAASMSGKNICPFFRNCPNNKPLVFLCESFYPERKEPTAVITLPADANAATFRLSWEYGSTSGWKVDMAVTGGGVDTNDDDAAAAVSRPHLERGRGPTRVSKLRSSTSGKATSTASGGGKSKADEVDMSGWFAVTPHKSCTHTEANHTLGFVEGQTFDTTLPCSVPGCGNVGENWMCLEKGCKFIGCSRHTEGKHFLQHVQQTGHAVGLGFVDLSVWCEQCGVYIEPTNDAVKQQYAMLYRSRFDTDDPQIMIAHGQMPTPVPAAAPAAPARQQRKQDDNDDQQEQRQQEEDPNKTGFAVSVKAGCEHTPCVFRDIKEGHIFDVTATCSAPGCNADECWTCACCGVVLCSRYRNKHMLEHFEQHPQHCIAVGHSDLSCWCFVCNEYLNPRNSPQKLVAGPLYMGKHGVPEDGCATSSSAAAAAASASGTDNYSEKCPHLFPSMAKSIDPAQLGALIGDLEEDASKRKCGAAGCNSSDIYIDASDGTVRCSRYANAHMVEHTDATGHEVVLSFGVEGGGKKLECFCLSCDEWISPEKVLQVMRAKGVKQ